MKSEDEIRERIEELKDQRNFAPAHVSGEINALEWVLRDDE